MSKGIAISTILYMLLGILVVGVVVYMVYVYVLGPGPDEQQCRTLAISWCTNCYNANGGDWTQDIGPVPSTNLQTCATTYFGGIPGNTCKDSGTWCSVFI